jgi:broad specificity phosphatase PhoE
MTSGAPRLYMVRHGATDFNAKSGERIRSWMDVPLSEEGELQARDAARFFQDKPIVKVVASDLKRARSTGDRIAEENFIPIEYTGRLRDWNVGEYCGVKVKDVLEELFELIDNPHRPAPGGESFQTYLRRFQDDFEKLLNYTRANSDQPIVAVTHSRNFGAAHAYLTGDTAIYKAPHSLAPGGVMAYVLDDSQGWSEVVAFQGDDQTAPSPADVEEG